jgi:tetratricopeptide (TPR) repeat protein
MAAANTLRQALDLFREGDFPRAQMLLETMPLEELDNDLQVEAHYLWGRVLVSRGDPMEAAQHFQACVKLSPRHVPALDAWGNVLAGMGDARGAIEKYRRVLSLAPPEQAAHVLFNYATVLLQSGALARALKRFRECFKRDNRRGDAAYGAADCYLRMNRPQGALKWLRIAESLDAKSSRIQVAMGNAFALASKADKAMACFGKAIALDPKCSDAYYNWAVALARVEDYLGAVKKCKAGLKQSPDSFELHVEHMFCLRKMGAFDAALQVAKRARQSLKAAPSDRRGEFADLVACNEAVCLRELGELERAKRTLREFLAESLEASRHSVAELRYARMVRLPKANRFEMTLNVKRNEYADEALPAQYTRVYWVIAATLEAARELAREQEPALADVRYADDARVVEELTNADSGVVERTAAMPVSENNS